MSDRDSGQKTEQPTPRRREEARERGQVPRSRDLAASLGLLGAFLALRWFGPGLFEAARGVVGGMVGDASAGAADFTIASVASRIASAFTALLAAALPIFAVACAVTVAASVVQGSAGIRFAAIGPDFTRIDPFEGAKRLLNWRSAARGGFAILKIGVVAWLGARVLASFADGTLLQVGSSAGGLWMNGWREAIGLGIRISIALALLGGLEYGFQRWMHERDLRMTRADVLEEISSLEGNPELKRRRRRAASEIQARSTRLAGRES
jgi:flagellar biosynthetic protein FlhB